MEVHNFPPPFSMGPTMAMSVAVNDIASNVGEENLSSPKDLKVNPPVAKTNNSTGLSANAFDKEAGATKAPSAETKVPSSLKSPPRGRGTGFSKQEILFLAKAYMRASSDPIVGTFQSDKTFYQKVCNNYNQLVAGWNQEKDDSKCVLLFSFCTKYSLQSHFWRCLQPAVQKFAGIESCYRMKSGENEEKHLGRLIGIYEEEMKRGAFQKSLGNI